jgi:hypothetical protein
MRSAAAPTPHTHPFRVIRVADLTAGGERRGRQRYADAVTSTPSTPEHDGSDLAELREEIDALKAIPYEEIVNPLPTDVEEREPDPHATDAIGSEKWDRPADEETLDR